MKSMIYTNDNCISCNKCVRVCTSPGASYVEDDGKSSVVHINPDKCISCGACFAMCNHNAREYVDDTDAFFEDLEKGVPISILLAPSFLVSYPKEYGSILGALKFLGVRRIISVSFGADICTWGYLKYMKEHARGGLISSPCPVAVSYIEHCMPDLIDNLIPVQSPMVCAATYCREEMGVTDRFAFIGPCIGKRLEMDSYKDSPVHYNVTFLKLMEYVRNHHLCGPDASDEIEYGLGSFYPAPGGLAENVAWFVDEDAFGKGLSNVRVVSGKTYLYGWLAKNRDSLKNGTYPFLMADVLNCQDGCLEGTACETHRFEEDLAFHEIQKVKNSVINDDPLSPWNPALSKEKRLENLNRMFDHLDLSHYLRRFKDRSQSVMTKIPTDEEADAIFKNMHKDTEDLRRINCTACGYDSCYDMMVAIYNGFNTRHSCIRYEMAEAIRLERLSMSDQLTGVMNRSGLQNVIANQYHDKPLAVIAVDINGLKEMNDTYGHEAGDRLIVETANCLAEVFGSKRVFRTGGDEFLVIQQDFTEDECCLSIEKLKKKMAEKNVSAAVGYSYSPCFGSGFAKMQEIADKKMYEDKDRYYQASGRKRR